MATRRMFSQEIVGCEEFLEMPTSSRELYFQLGMYADDDGFVNPHKVSRIIGANGDDLKVLIAKGFILTLNDSRVMVIRHWKQNNYIQKDRYRPTIYTKELNSLSCIQNVYNLDTQVRLGKDSIGRKDIESQSFEKEKQITELQLLEQIKKKAFGIGKLK